jgi:Protein of unknown function (DUF2699).
VPVLPAGVVEHLDVVEDVGLGLVPGGVDPAPDALALEELEEAFGDRVVMAVAAAAHAADQAVGCQEILPIVAGVLRSLIGVNEQSGGRLAAPHRHHQRLQHQVGVQGRSHRPADDLPGEQVHDRRQVQPAFVGADVGDVGDPGTIGGYGVELPCQMVVCDHGRLASAHAGSAAITNLRPQAFATHQPGHPVLAAALAQITQVAGNLAVAVHAPALQPGLLDQAQYAPIVLGPCRQRRPTPGVVAAGVHAQHPAHAAHPELPFVVAHEGVLHPDCLAKYAAAFLEGNS